jgi:hypothetical protein
LARHVLEHRSSTEHFLGNPSPDFIHGNALLQRSSRSSVGCVLGRFPDLVNAAHEDLFFTYVRS